MMDEMTPIISTTAMIEAMLLLKRHFCSIKLAMGKSSKASKNEVSSGARMVCPKMAR
ncbi:hypothetical protein D3C86_2100030 [compost metagenome]